MPFVPALKLDVYLGSVGGGACLGLSRFNVELLLYRNDVLLDIVRAVVIDAVTLETLDEDKLLPMAGLIPPFAWAVPL